MQNTTTKICFQIFKKHRSGHYRVQTFLLWMLMSSGNTLSNALKVRVQLVRVLAHTAPGGNYTCILNMIFSVRLPLKTTITINHKILPFRSVVKMKIWSPDSWRSWQSSTSPDIPAFFVDCVLLDHSENVQFNEVSNISFYKSDWTDTKQARMKRGLHSVQAKIVDETLD